MALEMTAKPMEIDPKFLSGKPDDLMIHTPPLGSRKPAKLRLSTSSNKMQLDKDDQNVVLEEEFPLTDKKRSLYEPLGPSTGRSSSFPGESFLPPPDFETAAYPRGWVIGKKRKLVNVDVVESMRRIAVQEMNRKDREITELNEQLEEDSRTMEHLQMQLQQERAKRAHTERENAMLQGQVNMLMTLIPEQEPEDGETFET